MTLITIHIIISFLSLAGTISLLISSWRSKHQQTKAKLVAASLVTTGSVVTGAGLLFQGARLRAVLWALFVKIQRYH